MSIFIMRQQYKLVHIVYSYLTSSILLEEERKQTQSP